MKKLLSLIAAIVIYSGINAQSSTTTTITTSGLQKWRFGVKGTIGGSWLKSNKSTMSTGSAGFQYSGGLVIERNLSKTVAFVTGIDISSHSGGINFDTTNHILLKYNGNDLNILSRTYRFQSIDIPLSLKLKTNEIGYFTYWMQVGAMPSIMWKATASDNKYNDSSKGVLEISGNDATLNVRNDAYLFRGSIIAGLGVEYSLAGSTALLVGLHYVDGFTSTVSKNSSTLYSGTSPAEQAISSKYVMLTAGFLF
ncbi:MAG: porin family protein [Bacteroidetes bacterium]|nr:porin family protein [Bacteroidota bacterium]